MFAPIWAQMVGGCLVVIVALVVLWHASRRWARRVLGPFWTSGWRPAAAQWAAMGLLAAATALVFHWTRDAGFLVNANATASIQDAHFEDFLPLVDAAKLRRLLKSNPIVVDARLPNDYAAGHIGDAINVPVNAPDDERAKALGKLPRKTKTVVYCQSASCSYALRVAEDLHAEGFENILLFKGGWREWQETMPREGES